MRISMDFTTKTTTTQIESLASYQAILKDEKTPKDAKLQYKKSVHFSVGILILAESFRLLRY